MLSSNYNKLTFEGHLNILRKMLIRILSAIIIISLLVFINKDLAWKIILAPSEYNFITYKYIEQILQFIIDKPILDKYTIELIAIDLTSQFLSHIKISIYFGLILTSPYIIYEILYFIIPALYANERKYSIIIVTIVLLLFIIGILFCYFIIFPISFRFLGTYSVADKIHTTISLDSYISAFSILTLTMGIVIQLPILILILTKIGIVNANILSKYRKYAIFIIILISAIITPPDIISCIIVSLPLCLLYECSIFISKRYKKKYK